MKDLRRNPRIKENIPVHWQVEQHISHGQGRVLNLSTSGLLLRTESEFSPLDQCVFLFNSALEGSKAFLPNKGKLIWHQKKENGYVCGVEFIETPTNVINLLKKRVEEIMAKIERNAKIINISGIVFSAILIFLTFYVLHIWNSNFHIVSSSNNLVFQSSQQQAQNYRTYVGRYTVTKHQLDITTQKLEQVNLALDQVTHELNATKAMLSETQVLLNEAQAENAKLKEELNIIDSTGAALPGTQKAEALSGVINSLKEENVRYGQQIDSLKNELKAFEIQLANVQEGKELLTLYRTKIKEIKANMASLNREAYNVKVSAQKERDRLETLAGNLGYLVKEGKELGVEKKSFAIDVKIVQ